MIVVNEMRWTLVLVMTGLASVALGCSSSPTDGQADTALSSKSASASAPSSPSTIPGIPTQAHRPWSCTSRSVKRRASDARKIPPSRATSTSSSRPFSLAFSATTAASASRSSPTSRWCASTSTSRLPSSSTIPKSTRRSSRTTGSIGDASGVTLNYTAHISLDCRSDQIQKSFSGTHVL